MLALHRRPGPPERCTADRRYDVGMQMPHVLVTRRLIVLADRHAAARIGRPHCDGNPPRHRRDPRGGWVR